MIRQLQTENSFNINDESRMDEQVKPEKSKSGRAMLPMHFKCMKKEKCIYILLSTLKSVIPDQSEQKNL